MKRAMINPEKCHRCNTCEVEAKCPEKAIIREEQTDMPWIDFYKCRGCMECKLFCRHGSVLEEAKPCDRNSLRSW